MWVKSLPELKFLANSTLGEGKEQGHILTAALRYTTMLVVLISTQSWVKMNYKFMIRFT